MAASSLRLLPRQRSLFHPTSVERCAQIRTPVPQESRPSAALERRLSDRNNSCQRDVFPAPRSVVIPVVQAYGSGRSVQRSLDGIMIFVLEEDGVKTPPSLTMPLGCTLGCEPYRFA